MKRILFYIILVISFSQCTGYEETDIDVLPEISESVDTCDKYEL